MLVGDALAGLGEIAARRDRMADAVPLFERSLAIRKTAGAGPDKLAGSHFSRAQTLWDRNQPGDRPRARELAEQAQGAHRSLGPGHEEQRAAVEAWIAARPPARR